MKTYLRKVLKRYLFLLVSCALVLGNGFAEVSSAEAAVNGRLRQVGNQQILNLWGSNYEMGYAHGYLMADKIRDLIDTYVVGVIAKGDVSDYTYHLSLIPLYQTFHPEYLDEINGMVAGMIDSGKSLYVSRLGRNIDDRDIKAFNLFIQYSFGCSSFGVWGSSTANGETILARNYDFYYDPQGNILNNQILITYEPTGKPKFVSFAWPGWYGIATGINEYGITAMVNAGNAGYSSSTDKFYPSVEVYREIIENTTTNSYPTQPLYIVNSSPEYIPMIIQIGAPYQNSGDPVYYIEDSSDQNVVRGAAYTEPVYDHIIATNHYLEISPPPLSGESIDRYNTLRNGLINLYGTGDRKVDSQEAWSLLGTVSDIVAPTLTSIVVRPDKMEFDVAFAAMVNGAFKSAAHITPQTYTWAILFPSETLPDMIIQSIVPVPASPAPGQTVNVTVTVKNQGNSDSGNFTMDFYRNLSAAPAPKQTGDDYCLKSGLAAGATDSCTFTVTYSAAGSYNMWAQVDAGLQVTELDETNNVFGPRAIVVAGSNSPVVSITAPAANSTVKGTVYVAATATSSVRVRRVEFYINGLLKRTDTVSPYTYSWDTTSIANGPYSITAKAYDASGNVGQSSAVAVTVNNGVADTTAPTTFITSPAANAIVSGTVNIAASAADNIGVSKVEFYVNGSLKGTDSTAPYSYNWNTTSVANGSYSITARAYDAAGNVGQSSAVAVSVNNTVADTTAPTTSITSPAANAIVSGTVNIAASAADNVGVSRVEFYVNGSLKGTDTTAPYSYSWSTTSVANGSYSITARAYDAAGNVGQSAAVTVTVKNTVADTTAPTTSITSPAANATVSGTVNIAASAADNVGVSRVEFYVNGSLKGTDTTAPYSYSWSTTSIANGSYPITTRAYDAAGNVGQSAAVTVTVKNTVADTIAPTVAITSPLPNSTLSGTACAAVSASDNVGVTRVEYYVNGWLDNTVTSAPFGYCVATTVEYNGSYTIIAKAYDAAGNVGQSAAVSYQIKN